MKDFMNYNFDIESIMLSCFVPIGGGKKVHKNRPSHGIVFYGSGRRNFTFDETDTITVCDNEILYLPKGSNYTIESQNDGDCYAINFQTYSDVSFAPFKFKVRNHKFFADAFKSSEQAWRQKTSGYEMKCKSLLYDIIYSLRKEYEIGYVAKNTLTLIKPAIDYINASYTNVNIEITYLSELCNISEAYFRRIFLRSFGTSPIKYINDLKVNRAKELISSGLYSISEVAASSGFHDEAYFSRKFKESTGVSPSEYK